MTEETEERKCIKCRDWDGCYGRDWYSPNEITFCRWQMIWLLWHLPNLEDDVYPRLDTSYFNLPNTQVSATWAYFETPRGLAGVITERLEKTGKDGKILLQSIKTLEDDNSDTIYQYYQVMDRDAKAALGYISGRRWKRQTYTQWRWEKYKRKTDKLSVSRAS